MRLSCPRCERLIPGTAVNVQTDLAKCERCDEVFKASDLVSREPVDLSPPSGSRITFDHAGGDVGRLEIPRRGVQGSDAVGIAFATVWMGFIVFWTAGAATASVLFALFSIPFWLVGLGMWAGILNAIFESQTIEISARALTVTKARPIRPTSHVIPLDEIHSISLAGHVPKRGPGMGGMLTRARTEAQQQDETGPVPVIAHGTERTSFGDHLSEAEMKWLVPLVRSMAERVTGRSLD